MPKKTKSKAKPKPIQHRALGAVKHVSGKAYRKARPHLSKTRSWYKQQSIWKKLLIWVCTLVLLLVSTMYGMARWYMAEHSSEPMQVGVTFSADYARYLGLVPQQTLDSVINDLGMRRLRLVSYWNDLEPKKGKYDFSDLDWQFKMAEENNASVSLSVGLRQPRWPECHMPNWAANEPRDVWTAQLKQYMTAVVNRYKNSPALVSYQLENEYFLKAFGRCTDYSRQRLIDEYNLIKQADPNHPVIVSRSNNALGWPVGQPTPDQFGVSVYKRVWDKTITRRYFEYPFPAWFYGFLAGIGQIWTGKDMIIHELQAEPWLPEGYDLRTSTLEEQDKSMDAKRLKDRFEYGRATGIRTMDMWGVEWWYWRKVNFNDPSLWNTAKDEVKRLTTPDKQCNNLEAAVPSSLAGNSRSPC